MSAIPKHLLTAEEFATLPHEGLRLELIKGEPLPRPLADDLHGEAAAALAVLVGSFIRRLGLGRAYVATGFHIASGPDTVLGADFAFIAASRVPVRGKPGWVRVIPDLVAEVVSSGDRPQEAAEKIQMWLDVGVRMVVVLYPPRRVVEVYRPGEAVLELRDDDTLEGGDVVPGFAIAVSELFG